MKMGEPVRFVVVGFGLAGASVAMGLIAAGLAPEELVVIEGDDSWGASRAPATMLHAFPGRTMSLRRGQGEAFLRSFSLLKEWAGEESDWWRVLTMVRPLGEGERGEGLRRSWEAERESYPEEIWSELVGPEELRERFGELNVEREALVYGPAAGVVAGALLEALRERLAAKGVRFLSGWMERLEKKDQGWEVVVRDHPPVAAREVILSVGARLKECFPGLDLRPRAGELLVLEPKDAALSVMFNDGKHIFARPDGLWGLGSTYFDVEEWEERREEEVVEELLGSLREELPALDCVEVVQVWKGVRAVFGSDHMPLVGAVPEKEGLHLFGGLGSKGLLWGPALGEILGKVLMGEEGAEIPRVVATDRVKAHRFVAPAAWLGYPAE